MQFDQLSLEYQKRTNVFEELRREVDFVLTRALETKKIRTHSIFSRVKALDSFLAKAKRMQLKDPILEMQDVVGIRVVCLFVSDLSRVSQVIRDCFKVVRADDKIEGPDVGTFGYMSIHFVCTMKHSYRGPRYDLIRNLVFEVQVRTILMDAWATVSHYLDYKTDVDVPKNLRKDFYALSGLFYVADTHFEIFYKASRASRRQLAKRLETAGNVDEEINLDTVFAYLKRKFPDRKVDKRDVSSLVRELVDSGFTKIGDIDILVDRAKPAFEAYENEIIKKQRAEGKADKDLRFFISAGVVRGCLAIVDKAFRTILLAQAETHDKSMATTLDKEYETFRTRFNIPFARPK